MLFNWEVLWLVFCMYVLLIDIFIFCETFEIEPFWLNTFVFLKQDYFCQSFIIFQLWNYHMTGEDTLLLDELFRSLNCKLLGTLKIISASACYILFLEKQSSLPQFSGRSNLNLFDSCSLIILYYMTANF